MPFHRLIVLVAAALAACVPAHAQALKYRWVYCAQNLQVNQNVQEVLAIMDRAAAAGYNGLVLADYKLQILDKVPDWYFTNVAQIKAKAAALKLDLYPMVCGVGYANGLLSHDVSMVEAQPVVNALFKVSSGQADVVAEPPVNLLNGDFETAVNNKFSGWSFQDDIGKSTFADTQVKHGGKQSIRMQDIGKVNQYGNCRVIQPMTVAPNRYYHLSGWVKSQGFDRPGNVRIQAISSTGKTLAFIDIGVQGTQDWTRHHIVFNSQDATQVNVYFGVWDGNIGTLWWDDCVMEELGVLNVVRRAGCPLTVKSTGGTVYAEGVDFEPVIDPKMGNVPYAGGYDVYHTPPKIAIKPGGAIKEGQSLRVGFFHAALTDSDKVACCLSEPAMQEILNNQLISVHALLTPKGFFFAHDEIRVANWCDACRARGLTPGQLLAGNIRWCIGMSEGASGELDRLCDLFVWSDMFDPYHNAHNGYYLVNGTLADSWDGLPTRLVVVNWNFDGRAKSLPFFAQRGHAQILAGYYDGDPGAIKTWLDDAKSFGAPVAGAMYTTWAGNYGDLEVFARAAWGN